LKQEVGALKGTNLWGFFFEFACPHSITLESDKNWRYLKQDKGLTLISFDSRRIPDRLEVAPVAQWKYRLAGQSDLLAK
jgi:hypothetical protein